METDHEVFGKTARLNKLDGIPFKPFGQSRQIGIVGLEPIHALEAFQRIAELRLRIGTDPFQQLADKERVRPGRQDLIDHRRTAHIGNIAEQEPDIAPMLTLTEQFDDTFARHRAVIADEHLHRIVFFPRKDQKSLDGLVEAMRGIAFQRAVQLLDKPFATTVHISTFQVGGCGEQVAVERLGEFEQHVPGLTGKRFVRPFKVEQDRRNGLIQLVLEYDFGGFVAQRNLIGTIRAVRQPVKAIRGKRFRVRPFFFVLDKTLKKQNLDFRCFFQEQTIERQAIDLGIRVGKQGRQDVDGGRILGLTQKFNRFF